MAFVRGYPPAIVWGEFDRGWFWIDAHIVLQTFLNMFIIDVCVTHPVAMESVVMVTAMPGFDNHGLKAHNTTQHHTYIRAALSYSKQHGWLAQTMASSSGKIKYESAAAVLLIAASCNHTTLMLLLRLRWGILCRCELLPKHISLHPNMRQVMQLDQSCISKK